MMSKLERERKKKSASHWNFPLKAEAIFFLRRHHRPIYFVFTHELWHTSRLKWYEIGRNFFFYLCSPISLPIHLLYAPQSFHVFNVIPNFFVTHSILEESMHEHSFFIQRIKNNTKFCAFPSFKNREWNAKSEEEKKKHEYNE